MSDPPTALHALEAVSRMWRSAPVAARMGSAMMITFGVLGLVWVVAERLSDPGGLWGALIAAALVGATALLSVLVVRAPARGRVVLTVTVVALVLFLLVDAYVEVLPRDTGPVAAVTALVLVVPLALLGLRRWSTSGWLLLVTGVVLVAARLLAELTASGGVRDAGLGIGIGGSSGAVALPMILGGLIFLTARQRPADGPDRPA